jgi:hypothetical protein
MPHSLHFKIYKAGLTEYTNKETRVKMHIHFGSAETYSKCVLCDCVHSIRVNVHYLHTYILTVLKQTKLKRAATCTAKSDINFVDTSINFYRPDLSSKGAYARTEIHISLNKTLMTCLMNLFENAAEDRFKFCPKQVNNYWCTPLDQISLKFNCFC